MPDVYAMSFAVEPKPGYSAADAMLLTLHEWVTGRCPELPSMSIAEPFAARLPGNNIFNWEPYTDGHRTLAEFEWRHPHDKESKISWSTNVSFIESNATSHLTVTVANTGPNYDSPGVILTSRPRLLLNLLEFFTVRCDGERCILPPETVPPDTLPYIVRYVLFDPTRQYPVIVVSPDSAGQYIVSPDALAREYLSLAKMYVLKDPDTTFVLTDEMGGSYLSCFHGAARIYLPGLSRSADPTKHPLLLPRRLLDPSERMKIATFLAALTPRRFKEQQEIVDVRTQLRDDRAIAYWAKRQELTKAVEHGRQVASARADVDEVLELVAHDNEQLSAEIESLRGRLQEAEGRMQWLEKERKRLEYALEQATGSTIVEAEDILPKVETVMDAVEAAQQLFSDTVLILPSAIETATGNPYRHPVKVLQVLKKMADLSQLKMDGALNMPLREAFRREGVDYRQGTAGNTPKKLMAQYYFLDGSNRYFCEEHICLGGGTYDPAECLRIYFTSRDETEKRFVIGHVGQHLQVISTT